MFFEDLYKKCTQRLKLIKREHLFFCNAYFSKCNYKLFQNSISAESSNFHRNRTACSWNIQNNAKNVWVIKKYLTKHFTLGSQSGLQYVYQHRKVLQTKPHSEIHLHPSDPTFSLQRYICLRQRFYHAPICQEYLPHGSLISFWGQRNKLYIWQKLPTSLSLNKSLR